LRRVTFIVGLVALGAIACAESSAPYEEVPTDWDNPIGGKEVRSFHAAAERAPFELYRPTGLGRPRKVFISIPARHPSAVAFLYKSVRFGLVVVIENVPDVPIDEYEESNRRLLAYNDRPDTHGTAEIVSIRDGREALVTTSEDRSSSTIFWLQGRTEIVIKGP
jgi:hypothetical protein